MDIQVKSTDFQRFLKRCHCNDLIKDLFIQADDKGLVARFSTKEKTLYGEVYLPNITMNSDGTLKIPRVKQLFSMVGRVNSDIIRLITRDSEDGSHEFCITDGVGVGKIKSRMLQTDDATVVESYDSLPDGQMFDTANLHYVIPDIHYENGCKVDYSMLTELLKDSKAFGYETYRFYVKSAKKGKDSKTYLMCSIVNEHTQETFNRTIAEGNFIGDAEKIPECTVGGGFREIVTSLIGTVDKSSGEEQNTPVNVNMYFHENSILLTDGKTFYFNIHTMEV